MLAWWPEAHYLNVQAAAVKGEIIGIKQGRMGLEELLGQAAGGGGEGVGRGQTDLVWNCKLRVYLGPGGWGGRGWVGGGLLA